MGVRKDVSGSPETELLHHERRDQYRLLFESSRDALMVVSPPDWKFIKANHATLEMFGVASEAAFTALSPWETSPPVQMDGRPSLEVARERIVCAMRRGSCCFEWLHQRLNGETFIAEVLLTRMKLASGVVILASVRDVSARKQVEDALRQSEEKMRTILTSLESNVVIIDETHTIRYINHVSPGLTPEEVVGSSLLPWVLEEDRGKVEQAIRQTFISGEPAEIEYRAIGSGREVAWFQVRFARMPEITPPSLVLIAHDITDLKSTEQVLKRTNRALRTLSEGNQALIHAKCEPELLQAVCRAVVEKGGYRMAWVGYAEQDAGRSIRPVAQAGFDEGYLQQARISWAENEYGQGPSGCAVRTRQTCLAQNIASDPDMTPWREAAVERGYAASIALPLLQQERCLGVLAIYAAEPEAFDKEEVVLLEEMAADLAFGIVTLRNQAVQREQAQRLQRGMLQTVEAICGIVEMRDPYTFGHQRRVADLAFAIAEEMGLGDGWAKAIHLAGLVHDLGKIRIPAEILSKPGRLDEIEFGLIRRHPQAGYDILKSIDFEWPIAQMVLQHHERMDGSGYPQGLKDEEIVLGARILSVADVVEAISSHRPYRPGLGLESALEELSSHPGRYDPQVVAACFRLFREQGYRL